MLATLRANAADADAEATVQEVVVTGTRATGIQASESPAPIQVLSSSSLENAGRSDLMQALANVVPSFTAQAFGGDQANQTLQAKLRGLSPNHVLVLIDGKRRHTTSNLAVLGGPYQGGAGADLNFIPVAAIDHIEVLTDGAAAQYGTDAIAGVINIILRKSSSGGSASLNYGQYFDGGGSTTGATGNIGLAPSDTSYLNLTAEVRNHGHSFRGGIDPRVIDPARIDPARGGTYPNTNIPLADGYPFLNKIQGDAEYHLKTASFNGGVDLGGGAEFYTFGTYGDKSAASFENYRLPSRVAHTDPVTHATTYLFPFGFNPKEATEETDYAFTAGVKGEVADWHWDVGTTYGDDKVEVFTRDSANASLYAATGSTPYSFHDGTFKATQWTTNIDVNKDFDIELAGPLNFAFGAEYRRETYTINAGDAASRYAEGGQSYPGFALTDAGIHDRKNYAGYVDFALQPITGLRLDLAGRFEHFSDFGNTTVGKLTGRYDFTPVFALRGTVSTGFRAPTLAEEFYSATNVGPATAFVQLPPNASAASLLGLGTGLQPEKSTNLSFGAVFRPVDNMAATFDVYQIEVRNRIVGTGSLFGTIGGVLFSQAVTNAIVANGNVLDPQVTATGTTGVNIFTNGITTRTRGADLVFNYNAAFGAANVDWSVGATYNDTKVTSIRSTPTALVGQELFDATAISDLETASPKYVLNLGALLTWGSFSVNLHEVVYGESSEQVNDFGDATGTPAYYETKIGVVPITNLEFSLETLPGLKLSVGAVNLFNRYPSQQNSQVLSIYRAAGDNSAVQIYPSFSPFGINGGFYYGKVSYNF